MAFGWNNGPDAMKKTKKRMTGVERKRQIVKVATALFVKKGFKGTTTREIARMAGISEAVIFRHFSKKEVLYKAIIDSKCNDSQGEYRLMNAIKEKKGKDVFLAVAVHLITEHQSDPSLMRLLTYSALENQSLSKMFIKSKGFEVLGFLEERIKELVKAGEVRKLDPKVAARAFLGMVLHYTLSQEIFGLKKHFDWPCEYIAKNFVEIFFEGIKKPLIYSG
jgi:AcrR family transcriptional regulator